MEFYYNILKLLKINMVEKSLKEVGTYRFHENDELGKGQYGKVYKGAHITSGMKVAVKQIPKKIFANEKLTELVIREITIAKAVQHNNIVKCLDAIQTPNNLYIITEYCDGCSLEKYLSDKNKLTEVEAVKYLKQVVGAYACLFENKIIHRDIKPANLIFNADQLKICDLGFAKVVNDDQSSTNTILGTPLYMSPELLMGENYNSKCDVWALGFVFYQMLFGLTPWTGKSQIDLYNNINSIQLKFSESTPVSDNAKDLLKKMLDPAESKRISWPDIFKHPLVTGSSGGEAGVGAVTTGSGGKGKIKILSSS